MSISSSARSPSSDRHHNEFSSRSWLLICALVAAIWFGGLGFRPLLSPDEGRYAEIAREMALSNDFVTPRLNGLKYFEKPPLHYWLTAIAFKLFGESETSARLVPALYGLGIGIAIYCCLLWLHGRACAQRGFLLAMGTCWIVAMGHFIALDVGLTFWLTVCVCGLLGCIERQSATDAQTSATPNDHARSRWPDYWVWIGVAGAFLSKGLVGGVIPVAALGITVLLTRRWRLIGAVRWLPGFFIFLALVLPWLILIQIEHPSFFEFFFIREHFQRFTTKIHKRVEPWWFFIPVLLMGGLPWLGHWLAAILSKVRTRQDGGLQRNDGAVLLLAWSGFTLVFFSLSGSKLPSYILPIFPAMALWLARTAPTPSARALRLASLVPLLAAVLAGLFVFLQMRQLSDGEAALERLYIPWIGAAALSIAAGALLSWQRSQRGLLSALAPLSLSMLLATQCLQWGHAQLAERFSSKGLVERLLTAERGIAPEVKFFSVGTYDQTLPFYLKRTLTLVDYRDEMDMGLLAEPGKNGPSEADLLQAWPQMPLAYAVLDHQLYQRWQSLGVPLREVARNPRRVVIANR